AELSRNFNRLHGIAKSQAELLEASLSADNSSAVSVAGGQEPGRSVAELHGRSHSRQQPERRDGERYRADARPLARHLPRARGSENARGADEPPRAERE